MAVVVFLAAGFAGGTASLLIAKRGARGFHRSLASLLGATAVAHVANGCGLLDEAHELIWRKVALMTELQQPALLLYAGLAFLDPAALEQESFALWRARCIGVVGLLLALFAASDEVFRWTILSNSQAALALGAWWQVLYVFIVIGMALALAQLEVVLRASREPFRHKLKFVVIGLGGLAGYQIYQASQMLLFPVWQHEHVIVSSIVTVMALGLLGYGLGRTRFREVFVHAYVSPQALVGSVSFIVIGLYLLAVGLAGAWLRETNQPLGVGLSVVVVFGALVGLTIALFSKTVRAEIRRVLTRNFYRSKYDYRAQWQQVTETFQQATNKDAIMDCLLHVLIKTFATTTVAIWSFREADRRFCRIRSVKPDTEPPPIDMSHPVVMQLLKQDDAVWVKPTAESSMGETDLANDPLLSSGAALCFPVRAQGRLMAFVVLGKQLHGEPYGTDDGDLLRGIAHHVGMLLAHARLAEERRVSAELEVLHRFSVFCLHDLKNLAARLSLVAQNAEHHGRDPVFQESAMRTVADTAKKMTALMSKLSLRSLKPSVPGSPEAVDLCALIEDIVVPLRGQGARLHVSPGTVPLVMAVREEIHQVLLNVVLNAKQAIAENGDITITVAPSDGMVVITVDDTGIGIPADELESLFRPAQSNRPGGLGVGLYQCKQIIEAHGGTIQIRSEAGRGTTVRVELPSGRHSGARDGKLMSHAVVSS